MYKIPLTNRGSNQQQIGEFSSEIVISCVLNTLYAFITLKNSWGTRSLQIKQLRLMIFKIIYHILNKID